MIRTPAESQSTVPVVLNSTEQVNGLSGSIGNQDSVNLDVMRSVAVLFVVAFHVALYFGVVPVGSPFRQLGHWGVLMFFVHTSLVLMLSLERQRQRRPEQPHFRPFMLRRIFRIAPLATLVILMIVFLKLPVAHLRNGQFHGVALTPPGVLANLLFVQNFTHLDSLEAPLWSLPYEMQMYLVLPLLYLCVRRASSATALFVWWYAAAVICHVCLRFDAQQPFDMLAYVPCFLAGVGAYRLLRIPHHKWRFAIWPITLLGCAACYALRPTFAMSWMCCLALAIAVSRCADMARGKASRACHLLARYSYGVYLTHFICIWFAFAILATSPWPVRVGLFVVTAVALPLALYHLVEAPMIRWGARLTRNAGFSNDAVLQ